MALMQAWLGMDWIYEAQGPGDLGARLAAATAIADGGEEGVGSVVVVGSDCPFLRPRHLRAAVRALSDTQEGGGEEDEEEGGHDLVLGPATDGGYWLIGLRRPCPALFRDVDWGTSRVLNQTLARAESLGLKVKLLEALSDMDRPQDLALWRPPPLTSVVIPVVNEAECLSATLAAVFNGTSTHRAAATAGADRTGVNTEGGREGKGGRKVRRWVEGGGEGGRERGRWREGGRGSGHAGMFSTQAPHISPVLPQESTPTPSTTQSSSNREEPSVRTSPGRKLKIHDPHVEVIVVDGGSTDRSERVARALGARVIRAPTAGRALQMNLGAAAANGDILLFLHADTLLPPTWEDEVKGAFAHHPSLLATAFRLRIMAPSSLFRVIEAGVSARSRWPWSMPYGDQALAVRRSVFEAVGGYPDVPVMEDFSFIQALHKMARTPPTSRPGGRDGRERKDGRATRQGGGRRGQSTEAGGLYGGKIRLLPSAVRTSARRWERLGVVRTTLVNQCMVLGWYVKVDPNKLAAFYRQARAGGTGGGRKRGVEKRLVSLRGLWRRGGEEGAGRERGSEGREGGQAEGPGPARAPPVSIRMGV
jgi:rSAM/selenodomain-associated transferase 1